MRHYEEWKIRHDLIAAGKMLYGKGNLISKDGNLSARLPNGDVLITCSGCCKGEIRMEQISKIGMDGTLLSGDPPARDYRMHLAIYYERPDACAIVHTHPPVSTGFAISSFDVESVLIPEVMIFIGEIAFAEYATPTTKDVADRIIDAMRRKPGSSSIIMSGHGALTFDTNVMDAAYKILSLDMALQSVSVARLMGGLREITDEDIRSLNRALHDVNN